MMTLTWLDPDHLEIRDVAGAVALLDAAQLADSPHECVGPLSSRSRPTCCSASCERAV
jgi:hypothetical protein